MTLSQVGHARRPHSTGKKTIAISTEEQIKYFMRHAILLDWRETPPSTEKEPQEPKRFCASGFLSEANNLTWLITAGHVFEEHVGRKKLGYVRSDVTLRDNWGGVLSHEDPGYIPYDFFDVYDAWKSYDKETGLDFAAIPLIKNVGDCLTKTTTPFRRKDWQLNDAADFHSYCMLGFPSCFDEISSGFDAGGRHVTSVSSMPVLLPLTRLSDDDPCLSNLDKPSTPRLPQFYGHIRPHAGSIQSVAGMSGGPILGFCDTAEGMKYYPIAIQSSWYARKRIVRGQMLQRAMAVFEEHVDANYVTGTDNTA